MNKILYIVIIIFTSLCAHAQSEKSDIIDVPLSSATKQAIKASQEEIKAPQMKTKTSIQETRVDTTCYLHDYGAWQYNYYPVPYGLGYCQWGLPWGLHKGLNISLGASVSFFSGSNAPKGAAFGQNISALYVKPIDDHWTFIVGGYFNNTYFAHNNYREAGLYGEITYKFNNHWEASMFGQKSLLINDFNCWMPRSLFEAEHMGDRIGASVRYNVSPSFSVQVSAEYQKLPDRRIIVTPPNQKTSTSKDF